MSIDLLAAVKNLDEKNMSSLLLKTTKYKNNTGGNYVPIADLVKKVLGAESIKKGIELRKNKLSNALYEAMHFGRVGMVPIGLIDINIDIQRGIEIKHIGNNILPIFDPRITQPINLIYYPDTGRYTCWDGLQTLSTILTLICNGLIATDNWETFEIKSNIIDSDLLVPGASCTVAEAVANFGFRTLNGPKGRLGVDEWFIMRSEYHGARLYNSDLTEDLHSKALWECMIKHNMLPADKVNEKKPGYIPYISYIKTRFGHGTNRFDIDTFEKVIEFLSTYFIKDLGINASFLVGIAELFVLLKDQKIKVGTKPTQFNADRFARFLKDTYGQENTGNMWRIKFAQPRLKELHIAQGYIKSTWTDNCTLPFWFDDFEQYCEDHGLALCKLPELPAGMQGYVR